MTGSYDPELNYVLGHGNPGPDWNGRRPHGDNLYSDSVLALDADTGALKWHFQFTPHDTHDWDAGAGSWSSSTAPLAGQARKLIY